MCHCENDRNLRIYKKRVEEHKTLDSIASEFGLTRERVRQICKNEQDKINHQCKCRLAFHENSLAQNLFIHYTQDYKRHIVVRAINAVLRNFSIIGPKMFSGKHEWKDFTIDDFTTYISKLTNRDIKRMLNVGVQTAPVIFDLRADMINYMTRVHLIGDCQTIS